MKLATKRNLALREEILRVKLATDARTIAGRARIWRRSRSRARKVVLRLCWKHMHVETRCEVLREVKNLGMLEGWYRVKRIIYIKFLGHDGGRVETYEEVEEDNVKQRIRDLVLIEGAVVKRVEEVPQ